MARKIGEDTPSLLLGLGFIIAVILLVAAIRANNDARRAPAPTPSSTSTVSKH